MPQSRYEGKKRKWLAGAIKRPGALTAKAKAAGVSLGAFIRKVLKKGSRAGARTKSQAVLGRRLRPGGDLYKGKR